MFGRRGVDERSVAQRNFDVRDGLAERAEAVTRGLDAFAAQQTRDGEIRKLRHHPRDQAKRQCGATQVADQHLAFDLRGHGYRVDRQDVTQVADIHRVAALLVARITHAMARRVLADGYECAEGALSNPPRDCKRAFAMRLTEWAWPAARPRDASQSGCGLTTFTCNMQWLLLPTMAGIVRCVLVLHATLVKFAAIDHAWLLYLDPPDHTRLRGLLAAA